MHDKEKVETQEYSSSNVSSVMVNHQIFCCFCIPWVPSFCLIRIKPQFKFFLFCLVILGHQGSLEVIRRLITGFLLLLYSLGSQLSFDKHKSIVKIILFCRSFQVIRGRQRLLHGQTLDSFLLLDSLGSSFLFDFSFSYA